MTRTLDQLMAELRNTINPDIYLEAHPDSFRALFCSTWSDEEWDLLQDSLEDADEKTPT